MGLFLHPLQWMGAVRMRVCISNPHHSSPSVHLLWSEKLHVCKKQIHNQDILNLHCCFWPKYESIRFLQWKCPLLSPHIKIHQYICLEPFLLVMVQDLFIFLFWFRRLFHWRSESSYGLNDGFVTTNTQDVIVETGMVRITCGLLWCFFQAVWTLMLTAPIHCKGSIAEQVMQNFSKCVSDGETNSSKSWTGNFQQRLFFSASPLSGRCVWLNSQPSKGHTAII